MALDHLNVGAFYDPICLENLCNNFTLNHASGTSGISSTTPPLRQVLFRYYLTRRRGSYPARNFRQPNLPPFQKASSSSTEKLLANHIE